MNPNDMRHLTTCKKCLEHNSRAEKIIEHLEHQLKFEAEQAELWKAAYAEEIKKPFWKRIFQ